MSAETRAIPTCRFGCALLLVAMAGWVGGPEAQPTVERRWASRALNPTYSEHPSAADAEDIRAQLLASQRAVIASELAGKIASVPFREGQRFKKGDTLITYDCALHRARLACAVQAESAASKKLAVAQQLDQLSSISRSDLEQTRAALSVARAESAVERVFVQRCTVTAPYAGRVGEAFVRPLESVGEGKELLSIYDDSSFELETIVPSHWLVWLKIGYPMHITVDETGRSYVAEVARIAGAVDPVSQSVKVVGRLDGQASAELLPGMSGRVRITPPTNATSAASP